MGLGTTGGGGSRIEASRATLAINQSQQRQIQGHSQPEQRWEIWDVNLHWKVLRYLKQNSKDTHYKHCEEDINLPPPKGIPNPAQEQ